ncbi:ABC transporter permease [Anaerovorax odorimutans]|uniref:ABC transporter permease n=1 Tax=Anaerovorax odorimutans TaxID=109327 RepID=UPI0003F8F81B|nr:ABC transporter permease [Anaerovorax odorimutans]
MNNRDLFGLGIRNLLRRKTRTFLAVIGVVVGTCAIVVMLSIGFGLSANFQEQIESYGNLHLIDIYSNGGMMMGGMNNGKPAVLDDKAIAAIEKIEGVDAASPKESIYLTFAIGKYICNNEVIGLRPEVMQKFNYELQDGRLLRTGDKYTMVMGNQIPLMFFNPKKSQGNEWSDEPKVDVITNKMIITADEYYGQKRPKDEEKITYKEYKTKCVGVLANPNDDSAYSAFMPLDIVKAIEQDTARAEKEPKKSKSTGYENAMVYVGNINDVEDVSNAIRDMGFQTSSLNDWLKSMQETANMIQGILGGIGGISLFVAALGITNTMIMSIYERTKEIGVMKVIGANLTDIRKMFLLEAGMIGFIGGLIGLIISFTLSLLMNTVLSEVMGQALGEIAGGYGSTVSIIPWWVALGALGFSTIIGLLAGYYPAKRAMRLSALESLRNE